MISTTLGSSERFFRLHTLAGDLAEFAMVLYPLIVPHADEFGRLLIDPFTVKMRYFPVSQRTPAEFERALAALCLDVDTDHPAPVDHREIDRLLIRYRCAAGIAAQVVNFDPHQMGMIHKRKVSKFPPPPGWPDDVAGPDGYRGSLAEDELAADSGLFRVGPDDPGSTGNPRPKRREEKGSKENGTSTNDLESGTGGALSRSARAQSLVDLYHAICCAPVNGSIDGKTITTPELAKVSTLSPRRIAHANARLKDRPLDGAAGCWREVFIRARRSPFLCGLVTGTNGGDPFRADFDWLTKNADNAIRVLEGRYDDRRGSPRPPTGGSSTPAGVRQGARDRHAGQANQRPRVV